MKRRSIFASLAALFGALLGSTGASARPLRSEPLTPTPVPDGTSVVARINLPTWTVVTNLTACTRPSCVIEAVHVGGDVFRTGPTEWRPIAIELPSAEATRAAMRHAVETRSKFDMAIHVYDGDVAEVWKLRGCFFRDVTYAATIRADVAYDLATLDVTR